MNIIKKLTLKNLFLNKKRSIVTIIGITLSVALITAVTSMVVSFRESLITYEKTCNGDYHYLFYNVDNNDLNIFTSNKKIETVYSYKELGYSKIDTNDVSKKYIRLLEMDSESTSKLGITLVKGSLPTNDNEVVISTNFINSTDKEYNIGDTINLEISSRYLNNTLIDESYYYDDNEYLVNKFNKEYTIVGIIERPSYLVEDYASFSYTFITYPSNLEGNNTVFIKYNKEGLKDNIKITSSILGINENTLKMYFGYMETDNTYDIDISKSKYIFDSNKTLISLEANYFGDSSMKAITIVGSIVIFIIMVTSVFCIRNSFKISITERIKEFGMLSSVGASSKEIKKSVYYEAFFLGIIGILLGILFGILASYILIYVVNYLLKDINYLDAFFIFKISFIGILISILISILTIYLSCFTSARKASKTSPIVNIRQNNEIKINKKKLKVPKLISKLFGIGGVISYKNIKRNKSKYRTTVISIIVSVSTYIALSYFVTASYNAIKLDYGEYNHNLEVTMTEVSDISKDIISLDNINNYSYIRRTFYEGNINKSEDYIRYSLDEDITYVQIISLGSLEYNRYIKELNLSYNVVKDKGILINNDKAYDGDKTIIYDMLDVKDNETIHLVNSSDNTPLDISIIKSTSLRPLGYENKYGLPIIVVSDETMDTLSKKEYTTLYIDSSNPDKLYTDISNIIENKKLDDVYVANLNETIREIKNIYLIIEIFLYGFIIVISLIGVTNVFNTINTNMFLRKGEFASLKSIGMTKKEFDRMIFLESFLYSFKSLLIGIPIGIGVSYLIYLGLLEELEFNFTLPYKGILISIILVFILIFVLNYYSSKKASNGNIIEDIRNENI